MGNVVVARIVCKVSSVLTVHFAMSHYLVFRPGMLTVMAICACGRLVFSGKYGSFTLYWVFMQDLPVIIQCIICNQNQHFLLHLSNFFVAHTICFCVSGDIFNCLCGVHELHFESVVFFSKRQWSLQTKLLLWSGEDLMTCYE